MDAVTEYLNALHSALEAQPTVKAAWLTGSFGRGNADRYSDVDINLWLDAADVDGFRQDTEAWLNAVRPLVLFRWMFNSRMVNALTADGLRLDLWLHTDAPKLDASRVKVLFDRDRALDLTATADTPDPAALRGRLLDQIREFWRCIAMTPVVAGREEHLVGLFGLTIEVGILTDVIISGYGIARDSGVKRLNPFLPEALRAEIEAAVDLQGLTTGNLVNAHLALARIMQREGRAIAERHGFAYPMDIETAALEYTQREVGAVAVVK